MIEFHEDYDAHGMSKRELAMEYNPQLCVKRAERLLLSWIRHYPGLMERLQLAGFTLRQRVLTPVQVKMIVDALGAP